MKYASKTQVIEAAQAAGSAAKTFKGAAKYLVAASRNTTPIEKRGLKHWQFSSTVLSSSDKTSAMRILQANCKIHTLKGYVCSCFAFTVKPEVRESQIRLAFSIHSRSRRLTKKGLEICQASGLWTLDEAITAAAQAEKSVCRTASSFLSENWMYKKSESRWAGGEHQIAVQIGTSANISSGSNRVWSDNGKWSGNNSYATLTVTPTTISLFPTLTTPDGLALIEAELIAPREYRIIWLEQGRGFELKAVHGWLIRGVHVQAETIEKARKKAFAARKKSVAAHMSARMEKRDVRKVWVGLDDSFSAGNCKPSTMAFYESLKTRFGAEVGGLRADVLLGIRDDIYTRRAVSPAASRYASRKLAA